MARESSTPPPSWAPPRAVWGAVTVVLMAVAAWITALANEHKEPTQPARHSAQAAETLPEDVPKREPTTDRDEIQRRTEYDALRRELTAAVDRIVVLEKRVCVLEQEARDETARRVQLTGGRRGSDDRKTFETATRAWPLPENATLLQFQNRTGSLREAADSAVAR